MTIILAAIFSLARAAHGGGHVSRLLSVLIMGLAFFVCSISQDGLIPAAIQAVICLAGLMAGLVVGWGKGFAAITGRYFINEKEFWPADKVGDWVYAKLANPYYAGVAFLTIRSILFYPLFIALAIYTGNYYGYLLSGLLAISMGVVYYLAGRVEEEDRAVRLAEVIYFAIIGGALA